MKRKIQCPKFLKWMQNKTPRNANVLDIGCGNKWYWPHVDATFKGIDAFAPFEPDYCLDLSVKDLPRMTKKFTPDVVYMFDFIEHVDKERGLVLLEQAKKLAPVVYLLTPTVWDDNDKLLDDPESDYYQNEHGVHKSLWGPKDFTDFVRVNTVFGRNYFHGVWTK